jgi:hypothetical protein
MWPLVSESRKPDYRRNPAMMQIQQNEIESLFIRSMDRKMHDLILMLSEEESRDEIYTHDPDAFFDSYLDAIWEVHDLSLLMDFTGNLDAPLP